MKQQRLLYWVWYMGCVCCVQEKGQSAHYKLTSTVMLWLQTIKEASGTINLGGSLTRQVEADHPIGEGSPHISNLGRMVEIGDLYSSDPNDLQLSTEFWPTADTALHQSSLHNRTSHRQISLSKFLSTCSNFLPAALFSSFMHMLTGLSSSPATAHHCFTMLKANSPTLGGGGASAAISLDHFFTSLRQYYLALRNGGGARAPPSGCVISPQEIQGLKDVLTIISTIAKQDESARGVMYGNDSWLPVASLFGLIGCPIPRDLKAKILSTLATFALSPEIAGSMWHTLEVAQVLKTTPSPGGIGGVGGGQGLVGGGAGVFGPQVTQEGNIQVELEEIESQAEEYPLTRAFLELLLVLIKVPLPSALGAGHRVPGFHPYLAFVRDAVFLKFDSRGYHDKNEKWEVARLSLEILYQLLSSHVISPEDFTEQQYNFPATNQGALGQVVALPKPPGHVIMEHMLNDSLLLKKVLSVLDEALLVLSSHDSSPPSEGVSHAALLSLQLLGAALEREEEFMDHVRRGKLGQVAVHPLHQLLLGVNPRSGKADHMINIARYVGVSRCSPEVALAAVQVLHGVAQTPKAGKDIAIAIMSNKDLHPLIVHGFVEHFEAESQPPQQTPEGEGQGEEPQETVATVNHAIQLQILKLLSSSIDMPAPNIAHLLLGFDTGNGKHVSETTLQDPGVSGSLRTCLHSILSLVDHRGAWHSSITPPTSSSFTRHHTHPKLTELCYKVLHQLCSHRDLSIPTLRYLRNNHDFFHAQLSRLPLDPSNLFTSGSGDLTESNTDLPPPERISLLHQQSWLLRSAAIELRMTMLNHLRSHTQRLLNLLLSEPANGRTGGIAATMVGGAGVESTTGGMGDGQEKGVGLEFVQEGRRKILVLLDMVDFKDYATPTLGTEYFDLAAVEGAIKLCEGKDPLSGALSCDVKQLHKMLMLELSTAAQGPSLAGHQQGILQEVHSILGVVVERNQVQAASHLSRELFESWRQLVETSLHAMLQDDIKRELKVAVLFELIQDLLIKVGQCDSSPLTTSVHGVILILLSHLRQAVHSNSSSSQTEDSLLSSLYSGPLLAIMSGLVESVLKAPAGMQQLRAYLYGSLLYYLSMTQRSKDTQTTLSKGVYRLWQPEKELGTMATSNLSTLNSFGEPFMDAVAKNACSGHDVARMLSLSVLDAVVRLDWQNTWLKFLTQQGYLQTLCASLQWDDDSLKKMLHPVPEALRALYIYESKMAFLTQVANNPVGARELTTINALNYLSQCHFIDLRPSSHGNDDRRMPTAHQSHGFIPTVSDRYRQLLFPVLKFLLALLTCPGSHHTELSSQVTSLIGAHSDVFAAILKDSTQVTMATLQELALVTAVIGNSGVGFDWSAESSTPFGAGLIRLQQLMLTLLPRFWSKQSWRRLQEAAVETEGGGAGGAVGEGSEDISSQAFLLIQQISANIVSYCRVAMTIGGKEFSSPYGRILLTPDLSLAMSVPASTDPFLNPASPTAGHAPSLGLLIQHLRECSDGFGVAVESYQHFSKKTKPNTSLNSEDIRQLLPRSVLAEKVGLTQQQQLARKYLKIKLTDKKRELDQYIYVVENLLYLLWRHLRYYLVYCVPSDPKPHLLLPSIGNTPIRRLQDDPTVSFESTTFDLSGPGESVGAQDLEQLKINSIKCFTDTLFKKLLDMEEAQVQLGSEVKVEFVQALVRRIKRLLKLKAAVRQL